MHCANAHLLPDVLDGFIDLGNGLLLLALGLVLHSTVQTGNTKSTPAVVSTHHHSKSIVYIRVHALALSQINYYTLL